jgi:hypothetical protein
VAARAHALRIAHRVRDRLCGQNFAHECA